MLPITITRSLVASASTAIAASQSPAAGAITINGSLASGGVATLDAQRRVVLTSGGNDSGVTFTVLGTNDAGFPISDAFVGGNGTTSNGVSNLDFKTVTQISHSGSIASTLTAGTGNTGSSLWQIVNLNATPDNFGFVIESRTGTAAFALEYTMDDPNILPGTGGLNAAGTTLPLATLITTAIGAANFTTPIFAWRLTTNSGTGTLVIRALQAGLASP